MALETRCIDCGTVTTQELCAACSQDRMMQQAQVEDAPARAITGTISASLHTLE